MKHWLLPEEGKFYKGNLHTHTTLSDGRFTPGEIKKLYSEKGYSVVAFTDHDIFLPHNDLTDGSFLALNSHEVEITEVFRGSGNFKRQYHLNFYAKRHDAEFSPVFSESRVWAPAAKERVTDEMRKTDIVGYYSTDSINTLIRIANENGFFVMYNHPVWSLQNYRDYTRLRGLWGIEVFNTGCVGSGLVDTVQPFVDLLREGERLFPLCTDDTHGAGDLFGGWVQIRAKDLDYETVTGALVRGDFYSSTGPEIRELYIEDGNVHIETSEVREILAISDWRFAKRIKAGEGGPISGAVIPVGGVEKKALELDHNGDDSFLRFEVVDNAGMKAYTRAYRISELFPELF